MKCKYCENVATVKDYRTWDGQTGSERVCADCFNITNNSVLDREAEVNKAKEEVFNVDLSELAEYLLETGWGEMWDTINIKMDDHRRDMINEFESQTGHEPHQSTLDKWDDNILSEINKLIKKSI